jgi:hypothetical protein
MAKAETDQTSNANHLNVLFAADRSCTSLPQLQELLSHIFSRLTDISHCSVRILEDFAEHHSQTAHLPWLLSTGPSDQPFSLSNLRSSPYDEELVAQICAWSDFLVLCPMGANNIACMLHGFADTLPLQVLRSWDVTKKIILIPGMSSLMWENPMTKKQLSKIRRKWNWVRVIEPILWAGSFTSIESEKPYMQMWNGSEDLMESVRTCIDRKTIGYDVKVTHGPATRLLDSSTSKRPALPLELWSMILEYTEDWELATALNIHTMIPVPAEWESSSSPSGPQTLIEQLEWTLLTGSFAEMKQLLESCAPVRRLSRLCIKLILRFANVRLLSYLETTNKDLFWSTFGHTFLPDKASSVFGRLEILDFWQTSPSFLSKEYTTEALDGASASGFVHILEWWYKAGLPLRYSEAALEQASSNGHIAVLEWWKRAADNSRIEAEHSNASTSSSEKSIPNPPQVPSLRLKPGKSVAFATQYGYLPVLKWWAESGIPFPHEDTVAKLASTYGHVHLLEYWKSLRGEKMLYDNQILVGPSRMGHSEVLEWWKRSGLRVEYKTCDIEEALEDGDEGPKGEAVKRWWAKNGLNLGVPTNEWMATKTLRSGQ